MRRADARVDARHLDPESRALGHGRLYAVHVARRGAGIHSGTTVRSGRPRWALLSGTGPSIADLLGRIEAKLAGELDIVMKLYDQVADCLGTGLAEGLKIQFDEKSARSSLRWYFVSDIPAPQHPLHPAISDVRFRSDLSAVEPRTRTELINKAPSVVQLLPLD